MCLLSKLVIAVLAASWLAACAVVEVENAPLTPSGDAVSQTTMPDIGQLGWRVETTAPGDLVDSIARACRRAALATVFEVEDDQETIVMGCQPSPQSSGAMMVEIVVLPSGTGITVFWPQQLAPQAKAVLLNLGAPAG